MLSHVAVTRVPASANPVSGRRVATVDCVGVPNATNSVVFTISAASMVVLISCTGRAATADPAVTDTSLTADDRHPATVLTATLAVIVAAVRTVIDSWTGDDQSSVSTSRSADDRICPRTDTATVAVRLWPITVDTPPDADSWSPIVE
jgi:hypothetical protein